VGKGVKYISDNLETAVKRKRSSKYDADLVLSRVVPLDDDGDLWQRHFAKADMVIEAVPENMALKHKVIQQAEKVSAAASTAAVASAAAATAHWYHLACAEWCAHVESCYWRCCGVPALAYTAFSLALAYCSARDRACPFTANSLVLRHYPNTYLVPLLATTVSTSTTRTVPA
jgi:3-hydroxyacyl-CoA dehydrogenase, NAD binding domain